MRRSDTAIVRMGIGMLVSVCAPWMTAQGQWGSEAVTIRGINLPQGHFMLLSALGVMIGGRFASRSGSALAAVTGLGTLSVWLSFHALPNVTALYPPGTFRHGTLWVRIDWGLVSLLVTSSAGTLMALLQIIGRLSPGGLLTTER